MDRRLKKINRICRLPGRRVLSAAACAILLFCGCGEKTGDLGGSAGGKTAVMPEILAGQTFVYDELETGEGDALYTLRFTEDGYFLNRNNGAGVLESGIPEISPDKTIRFQSVGGGFSGAYTGSSFESPSVRINYLNRGRKRALGALHHPGDRLDRAYPVFHDPRENGIRIYI